MKILLVFDSISPYSGGSQNAVLTWFRQLKRLGVEIKLLTDQNYLKINSDLQPKDLIINPSISLGQTFSQFSFAPRLLRGTKQAILDFQPDIVNLQEQLLVSLQVLQFARKHNFLTLSTMHGDPYKFRAQRFPLSIFLKEGSPVNRILRTFQFYLFKNSDYLTVPTRYYQKLIFEKIKRRAFVLPSPVAEDFFQESRTPALKASKLITVSRLAGEKHVDVLIDMMAKLKNRFTLTVMGEGIDKKFLVEKVKLLNLGSRIKFIGWVPRKILLQTLRQHHLFLSASNFETFGLTYIEALASGLPCLVYDYPVSREVIPEGMAIFLKSLNPADWAFALEQIYSHQDSYHRLCKNISINYAKLNRYNELESSQKLLDIYTQILTEKHAGISNHPRLQ